MSGDIANSGGAKLTENTTAKPERPPVTVEKPSPYTFDLGRLMAQDPNPLDAPSATSRSQASLNESLQAAARDGTQCLLNQLLTTCTITTDQKDGVMLTLPPRVHKLPRHKPLPEAKPPTKWERFAAKKGIKPKTNTKRKGRFWMKPKPE